MRQIGENESKSESAPNGSNDLECAEHTREKSSLINFDLRVPHVIADHMVLQRDRPMTIWGSAAPAEKISVSLNGVTVDAISARDGRWSAELPAMEAGGPFALEILGRKRLVIRDVLVGDVWFAGGQSNMEFPLHKSLGGEQEARRADLPEMRFFDAKQVVSAWVPKEDVEGNWQVCSQSTAGQFSAVAYHFAREVHQEENVPIGIIESSCSWTPAESWLSREGLTADPELNRDILKRWDDIEADYPQAREQHAVEVALWKKARKVGGRGHQAIACQPQAPLDPASIHRASGLWNGSVAPFLRCAIRGVIWYQGETNDNRGYQYRKLFPALMNDWRAKWQRPDLPFFWVQLANVLPPDETPSESEWAEVREAQLMSLGLASTGMAVTIDIGEQDDVHPKNKKDVGHRLALIALAKVYGRDLDYSGPIFRSMRPDYGQVRVSFDHVNLGLTTPENAPVKEFAVAGEDRRFKSARAEIQGREIVAWSDEVSRPIAVRYAWANNPARANLYSRTRGEELLPASPFRSDDWPGKSFGVTALVGE